MISTTRGNRYNAVENLNLLAEYLADIIREPVGK